MDNHSVAGSDAEQRSSRRRRTGPGHILAEDYHDQTLDLITDPAPIPDEAQFEEDLERESEDAEEFTPDALINEESLGQLFQNEGEAAEQFPEYFDEADIDEHNFDSQGGYEAAAGFNYEHLAPLTPQLATSIALYKGKIEYRITRDAFKYFCRVVSKRMKFHILDLRTVHKAIQTLTGVVHVSYDVCVNNCICFAEHPQQLQCPLCGEARYRRIGDKDVPRKTFDYIPVQHRLRLLYSNPKTAHHLKSYRKKLEDSAEGDVLRDFWDGKLCAELKRKGILNDPRSLAFYFSTDGVYLFRKG